MSIAALRVAMRDPLIRFLVLGVSLYLAWQLAYVLVIDPWDRLDRLVIGSLVAISGWVLIALGYDLIPEPANAELIRTIGVEGGSLLWIGDPCNGVSLFAVFLIFLAAFPGAWRPKLWFGVAGLLSIHLINVLRIVVLVIIARVNIDLLNFNHDYTFYVVVYGWVFLLWYLWIRRATGLSARVKVSRQEPTA